MLLIFSKIKNICDFYNEENELKSKYPHFQ
jgi:hypothetical protein